MRIGILFLLPLWLWALSLQPLAAPGGVALIELGIYDERPKAFLGDRPLRLERLPDGQYAALVGIDLSASSREAQAVRVIERSGTQSLIAFSVHERDYPSQYITIDAESYVHPSQEQLDRIAKERKRMEAAYARFSPEAIAPLAFKQPVGGRISGAFGLHRYFNGEPRNRHNGLDIAAPRHTPIGAPQKAEVIKTDDLFFCGKMVLLDHGQGLLTLYCHLESIAVRAGDRVDQGEVIGTVGSSGRATGPHLHWGVRLNGVWVDPTLLVAR